MQQVGLVHRGERAAQLLADVDGFARAEAAVADSLLERVPLDEIHPEADTSVVAVCAVDHHHVGMPHSYQLAGFVQNLRGRGAVGSCGLEELQRARVIEPGVERLVDFAVGAFADLANQE